MSQRAIAAMLLCGSTTGCGVGACLTLPHPAVHAEVTDSVTGAPLAYRASLIVEGYRVYDSTFVGPRPDSLSVSWIRSAPPGRTGVYAVRVRRAGYQLWQTVVHLEGDGCDGASGVSLSVRLQQRP